MVSIKDPNVCQRSRLRREQMEQVLMLEGANYEISMLISTQKVECF
jgi:hypothetical protein